MTFKNRIEGTLEEIREAGLFKTERVITTPQRVEIRVQGGREVLNFCANNYLGLADHPEVIAAAHGALDDHGFGLASVRFICGTQELHKRLEDEISRFLGMDAPMACLAIGFLAAAFTWYRTGKPLFFYLAVAAAAAWAGELWRDHLAEAGLAGLGAGEDREVLLLQARRAFQGHGAAFGDVVGVEYFLRNLFGDQVLEIAPPAALLRRCGRGRWPAPRPDNL